MLELRQDHFLRYGRNQNIPAIVRDQPLVWSLGAHGFGQATRPARCDLRLVFVFAVRSPPVYRAGHFCKHA